jgi:uncharacterized protein
MHQQLFRGSGGSRRRGILPPVQPFHMMTKPSGPLCNLDCQYCFYLEKERLYPGTTDWGMPDDVLESFIRQQIDAHEPQAVVSFAWQGGEPTLRGVEFFERVVILQEQHANGRTIENAIQTNGILIDERWCTFLAKHRFLVGLSVDGPEELHDRYRVDRGGQPTFRAVSSTGFIGWSTVVSSNLSDEKSSSTRLSMPRS